MHGDVYWLSIVGQVLGFIGAIYTIANPFMTKATTEELGATHWNSNPRMTKYFMQQSRNARIGMVFIAAGFLFQAIASIMSK